MSINAFIQPSPKFRDAFEVVVECGGIAPSRHTIPCANHATARSVRDGINNGDGVPVALPRSVERSLLSPEELGGCATGGLGYTPAVTWLLTGRVEQVHNWATARSLKRRFPPIAGCFAEGYVEQA